jgi:hypothetical protein
LKKCTKKMEAQHEEEALSPWQPLNEQGVRRISRPSDRAHERRDGGEIKVCTVNVGTMVGKGREVVDMLHRRRVDVCCVQEVRYKGSGTTTVGGGEEKYKFWYSGNKDGRGGVGIFVRYGLVEDVVQVVRTSDQVIRIEMVFGGRVYRIFSVYAPQAGRGAHERNVFFERLEEEMRAVPEEEGLIVGGDLNGHVGRERDGYEEVLGCYGMGERNEQGEAILDFCVSCGLKVANTYFKKDREKYITYKSGEAETQLDLILYRKRRGLDVRDCGAIPGEACLKQHRMVRVELRIEGVKKKSGRDKRK